MRAVDASVMDEFYCGYDRLHQNVLVPSHKGATENATVVDEDTAAFNKIMDAFGLPKKTDEEKVIRKETIENASKYVKPKSTIEIVFNEIGDKIRVHFKMTSLFIEEKEYSKLFIEE